MHLQVGHIFLSDIFCIAYQKSLWNKLYLASFLHQREKTMKKLKLSAGILLAFTIFTSLSPLTASAAESEAYCEVGYDDCEECTDALSEDVEVGSRLWELIFGDKSKESPTALCPGGDVFGIKIKQDGVTVIDAKRIPALKSGDIIVSINGQKVNSSNDIKRVLQSSGGESVTVRALHAGNEISVEIRPTLVDGEYKLGMTLRDGAAGIGTVTFVDPKTGAFGGLGHGICDSETGNVVPMERGEICDVVLGGVHRGEAGKPGELCGILTTEHLGTLSKNCECGVFGTVDTSKLELGEPIPLGHKDEVCAGEAKIISTIKNGKSAEYKVEIFDIDRTSEGSKSFKVRVTDPTLIAMTGGIVRGMSGSPIIQNGKLVGAVTHVLVANPTEGYGIFIENMLNAAENTVPKAA